MSVLYPEPLLLRTFSATMLAFGATPIKLLALTVYPA